MILASVVLAGIGVWLDSLKVIEQSSLFIAFHFASLVGVVLAVVWMWSKLQSTLLRIVLAAAALIIWRVAYFPIMVWAGWVATLGDWLTLQVNAIPSIIYPTFLVMMALLHGMAIVAGGMAVYRKNIILLPFLGLAFVIASLVSFTSDEDLTWYPDGSYSINQTLPKPKQPVANVYFSAMETQHYNIAEQVLVFASGVMYSAIPRTPWSVVVKGTLEQAFRDQPKASSAERAREHYLAFRMAQSLRCCKEQALVTAQAPVSSQ